MSNLDFERILSDIRQFADAAKDLAELQEFCVSRIAESLPHYNWVGFYMLATNDPDVLVLGPFRGAPTEHVRIPVARESAVQPLLRATPSLLRMSHPIHGISSARSKRSPKLLFRFGLMAALSARSTLIAIREAPLDGKIEPFSKKVQQSSANLSRNTQVKARARNNPG